MIPATTPASHAVRWRVSHHNEVVTSLARPASPVPYCLVTETAVLRTISPVDVVDAAVGAMLKDSTRSRLDDAQVEYRRADLTVRIAARHADPRTTMRYDRARKNLDRHPNYILAAYMASGT
mgnify:CR=1 FL=1